MFLHVLGSHCRVRQCVASSETTDLNLTGRLDTRTHHLRFLTLPPIRQLFVVNARHFEMDVDTVEQWPTDALLISRLC